MWPLWAPALALSVGTTVVAATIFRFGHGPFHRAAWRSAGVRGLALRTAAVVALAGWTLFPGGEYVWWPFVLALTWTHWRVNNATDDGWGGLRFVGVLGFLSAVRSLFANVPSIGSLAGAGLVFLSANVAPTIVIFGLLNALHLAGLATLGGTMRSWWGLLRGVYVVVLLISVLTGAVSAGRFLGDYKESQALSTNFPSSPLEGLVQNLRVQTVTWNGLTVHVAGVIHGAGFFESVDASDVAAMARSLRGRGVPLLAEQGLAELYGIDAVDLEDHQALSVGGNLAVLYRESIARTSQAVLDYIVSRNGPPVRTSRDKSNVDAIPWVDDLVRESWMMERTLRLARKTGSREVVVLVWDAHRLRLLSMLEVELNRRPAGGAESLSVNAPASPASRVDRAPEDAARLERLMRSPRSEGRWTRIDAFLPFLGDLGLREAGGAHIHRDAPVAPLRWMRRVGEDLRDDGYRRVFASAQTAERILDVRRFPGGGLSRLESFRTDRRPAADLTTPWVQVEIVTGEDLARIPDLLRLLESTNQHAEVPVRLILAGADVETSAALGELTAGRSGVRVVAGPVVDRRQDRRVLSFARLEAGLKEVFAREPLTGTLAVGLSAGIVVHPNEWPSPIAVEGLRGALLQALRLLGPLSPGLADFQAQLEIVAMYGRNA
jgi:hypothetical protein